MRIADKGLRCLGDYSHVGDIIDAVQGTIPCRKCAESFTLDCLDKVFQCGSITSDQSASGWRSLLSAWLMIWHLRGLTLGGLVEIRRGGSSGKAFCKFDSLQEPLVLIPTGPDLVWTSWVHIVCHEIGPEDSL